MSLRGSAWKPLLIVAALLMAGVPFMPADAASLTVESKSNVIVGFRDGGIDLPAVANAGGVALRVNHALGVVGVKAPDRPGFINALMNNPHVAFVETNDRIFAGSTGWDATGWNEASYDATGWSATGWDGTGWSATGWSATGWDGTGWSATGWDATGWDATGWDATGWDATGWDETGWSGTGWSATGWDGMNFAGTGWSATGWDATGWSATGWSGTGWSATGWDGSAWGSGAWNGSIWNQSFLLARASGQNGDPLTKYQWGWETVNAKQAIAKANTPSRAICIVDSGVDYTHPDLAGQMWRDPVTNGYGWDFFNNDSDPMDDAGHGTHVAGVAAAGNRNAYGMASVSGAKIMAAKVLNATGVGTELDLALAIQYCTDKGAKIISMSLSTDQDSPAVRSAVQYAAARDVVMVAAAGNTGVNSTARYPGAYPEVIAVAAVMPDGRWAPYSSTGPWVDIAAPGFAIVSTYKNGGYAAINGTSMATPFISATAALILQVNASFTPTDVKAILGRSAIDLGPSGPDTYVGFGFARADLAVKMAYSR